MIEHTIETVYKTKEGTGRKSSIKIQADGSVHRELTIPAGATIQVTVAIDVSEIKGLNIGISKGTATVKTNSSSEPTDTLSLSAKKDVIWTPDDTQACPLTDDVTALYITNTSESGEDLDFYLQAAVDSTPAS